MKWLDKIVRDKRSISYLLQETDNLIEVYPYRFVIYDDERNEYKEFSGDKLLKYLEEQVITGVVELRNEYDIPCILFKTWNKDARYIANNMSMERIPAGSLDDTKYYRVNKTKLATYCHHDSDKPVYESLLEQDIEHIYFCIDTHLVDDKGINMSEFWTTAPELLYNSLMSNPKGTHCYFKRDSSEVVLAIEQFVGGWKAIRFLIFTFDNTEVRNYIAKLKLSGGSR